jgi:hypothetical protein
MASGKPNLESADAATAARAHWKAPRQAPLKSEPLLVSGHATTDPAAARAHWKAPRQAPEKSKALLVSGHATTDPTAARAHWKAPRQAPIDTTRH